MHLRGQMFAEGESYHVFNRGAHKQTVFLSQADYDRFQLLLFLSNSPERIILRDILKKYQGQTLGEIFAGERPDQSLVDVLAYTLMPNHIHLVLRQKADGGVTLFMQKLSTAYSAYFNAKYDHSGVIFQGRYKCNHVDNEPYFRYIFAYVHLNPLELLQSDWKTAGINDYDLTQSFLSNYHHSSYCDYIGPVRPEQVILAKDDIPDFLTKQNDLEDLLNWQNLPETEISLAKITNV